MSLPTQAPYRFCTALPNRVAMSALRKLTGWVGGSPVPAGQNNDLQGRMSDWVTWLYDTVGYDMCVPIGAMSYVTALGGGATATVSRTGLTPGDNPAAARVRLTLDSGTTSASIFTTFSLPAGVVPKDGMRIDCDISGGSVFGTATVRIHGANAALLGQYEADISGTDLVLLGASIDIPGDAYATAELWVQYSSGLGWAEMGRLRIERSTP